MRGGLSLQHRWTAPKYLCLLQAYTGAAVTPVSVSTEPQMSQSATLDPASPQARQARQARVQDNVTFIRKGLDEIVTREARALGWSPADAKMIAASATIEYFGALSRHALPDAALRSAIEQADLKHVARYVELVAGEGKVSGRQALRDVLTPRLNVNDPQQKAALDLSQLRRVPKPSGRFACDEHVETWYPCVLGDERPHAESSGGFVRSRLGSEFLNASKVFQAGMGGV